MRGIFLTTLTLLALGWLASSIDLPPVWSHGRTAPAVTAHDAVQTVWRRTADGWEQRDSWRLPCQVKRDTRQPLVIHPLAIAVLQALVAVALGLTGQPAHSRC
jgi:hypothetical protein